MKGEGDTLFRARSPVISWGTEKTDGKFSSVFLVFRHRFEMRASECCQKCYFMSHNAHYSGFTIVFYFVSVSKGSETLHISEDT